MLPLNFVPHKQQTRYFFYHALLVHEILITYASKTLNFWNTITYFVMSAFD